MVAKMNKELNITTFDEHLDKHYGPKGTPERDEFDKGARMFVISELIKDLRLSSNMTQENLAKKSGTKKGYIARIESGKYDIPLSSLFNIIEKGFGKELQLVVK